MERREFIERDPLTSQIVDFMRTNSKYAFTTDDLVENLHINVTTKQVQMVLALLMREGMVKTTSRDGKAAYQIKV